MNGGTAPAAWKKAKTIVLKNGQSCVIRSAAEADAQAVYDCFLATHEQTDFLASYKEKPAFDVALEREFLAEKERSEREVYLCACVDGHIIGTACIGAVGGSKLRHRTELGIAIDRAFWGAGAGKALISACIECARAAGYRQMELSVVSDNTRAIHLYQSMGFVEFGRNPRGLYSGREGWQELILMRLELDR